MLFPVPVREAKAFLGYRIYSLGEHIRLFHNAPSVPVMCTFVSESESTEGANFYTFGVSIAGVLNVAEVTNEGGVRYYGVEPDRLSVTGLLAL